ncbi:hypothetical protein V5O48_016518 [Marasmius crinis-equi]|uniref:Nucleotidyl transferase AbiEii/AbiGii toxin family protein n=1 Tax=Marasmius crinis-equi TaxID=585013 RepID=A0ABR3ERN1_9AGAR
MPAGRNAGRDLGKKDLYDLFKLLSTLLKADFSNRKDAPARISLIVHGGAAIVCTAGFRATTRDVDFLATPFDRLLSKMDGKAPVETLMEIIAKIAAQRGMGHGWMNFEAELAISHIGMTMSDLMEDGKPLPKDWSPKSSGSSEGTDIYNVLARDAQKANIDVYKDDYLTILSLPWSWSFARKLDRWVSKHGNPTKDQLDAAMFLWLSKQNAVVIPAKAPSIKPTVQSAWVEDDRVEVIRGRIQEALQILHNEHDDPSVGWAELQKELQAANPSNPDAARKPQFR